MNLLKVNKLNQIKSKYTIQYLFKKKNQIFTINVKQICLFLIFLFKQIETKQQKKEHKIVKENLIYKKKAKKIYIFDLFGECPKCQLVGYI